MYILNNKLTQFEELIKDESSIYPDSILVENNNNLNVPKNLSAEFKQYYKSDVQKLFNDIILNDEIINTCIDIILDAAITRNKKIGISPITHKQFKTEEEKMEAINSIGLTTKQYDSILDFFEKIDYHTRFRKHFKNAVKDSFIGGRSAIFHEYTTKEDNEKKIPKGTPIMLIPLSWMDLGQVYVDKKTKHPEKITYTERDLTDKSKGMEILLNIRDMVYITNDDSHTISKRMHYGKSKLHSMIKLSNILRQILERDIPEIVTGYWAASALLETDEQDNDKIEQMVSVEPGGVMIVKRSQGSNTTVTPITIKHDGWFLIQILDTIRKHVMMRFRIPPSLLTYGSNSRSVLEGEVNTFRDFVILPFRDNIIDIEISQWYDKLLKLKLEELNKMDIYHNIKLTIEYEQFSVEDLLSKANSIELLVRRFVITRDEARQHYLKLREKSIKDLTEDEKQIQRVSRAQQQGVVEANNTAIQNTSGGSKSLSGENFTKTGDSPNNSSPGIKATSDRSNAKTLGQQGQGRGNER